MQRFYLSYALCALFSCSNFTFVQENLCGNRVVEPNEDCDGYAELEGGTCGEPNHPTGSCTYICDHQSSEVIRCPAGWSCGLDNRCRLAVGFLEEPVDSGDFLQGNMGAADFDGDLFVDLVAMRDNKVSIKYGDEDGDFVDELTV